MLKTAMRPLESAVSSIETSGFSLTGVRVADSWQRFKQASQRTSASPAQTYASCRHTSFVTASRPCRDGGGGGGGGGGDQKLSIIFAPNSLVNSLVAVAAGNNEKESPTRLLYREVVTVVLRPRRTPTPQPMVRSYPSSGRHTARTSHWTQKPKRTTRNGPERPVWSVLSRRGATAEQHTEPAIHGGCARAVARQQLRLSGCSHGLFSLSRPRATPARKPSRWRARMAHRRRTARLE